MAAIASCICALYVHSALSLLMWTVVPVVAGLRPVVITSGSMAPTINAGDIVLMQASDAPVRAGAVVMFEDPAQPDRLLTHRVVGVRQDGTFTTKGDANPLADSTPVPPSSVRGHGRAVIPAVGAPLLWVTTRQWPAVLVWVAASALAVAVLMGARGRRPLSVGWSGPLGELRPHAPTPAPPARPASPSPKAPWWEPAPRPARPRVPRPAVIAVAMVVAAAVVIPRATTAEAAFADPAANPGNTFLANTSFCTGPGVQTLTASGDAKVLQLNPTTNFGGTTDLTVDPRTNRVARSLVRFALPAQPSNCLMTATLQVYVTTPVAGRTLQVWRAGSAWAENSVNWNTQPAPAGAQAATATTPGAAGWISFDVSAHVAALYAGTDNGFLLKDAAEGTGANLGQVLASRTGANPPQLVLNFTPVPLRPAAPSGLIATPVSDSRVGVTWTENATNEDTVELERSPGGAGTWTNLATLSANATSYSDTGLLPGTAYDYRVRTVNLGGPSAWSNVAQVTTNVYPPAPAGLAVVAMGVNNAQLSWTDTSDHEVSFRVEKSPAEGLETWTFAGTAGANATTFNATGLTANTGYKFRVNAQNTGGDSAWSNVVTGTTNACATVPAQTLTASADAALMQVAPTTAVGNTQPMTFLTRARVNENVRSLVQFPAPTTPLGCSVATATLRLNVTSQTAVRTVHVVRANAAWTETAVTWNTQPATIGTPVAQTTAIGWVQWNVTNELLAMLAGSNHGFLVSDANEGGGSPNDTNMSSREGANPPQVVVTFGP